MKALVTGAGGFVGRYLTDLLSASGYKVHGVVFSENCSKELSIPSTVADIRNQQAMIDIVGEVKPDCIYHLAGITFVPEAEKDYETALQVNVGGTWNICEAVAKTKTDSKLVYVSSGEVYGRVSPEELPLEEGTLLKPANSYSLTKQLAESVVEKYRIEQKLKTVVFRPFNHVGPGQGDNFVTSSFAKQLAEIAAGKKEPLLRVGNLEASRDFSDVRDIVKAYVVAGAKGAGTYNLCSGIAIQILEILNMLVEIAEIEVEIITDPDRMRPSDVPEIRGNAKKAKQDLGWKTEIPLRQSLQDIYSYWQTTIGAL